jgi:SAM-dependent methyltransferase
VKTTTESPWLHIPAADYEAHMDAIGQSSVLREAFARIYAAVRPRRVLVLGCTTGRDFMLMDPAVTDRAVGVDVNGEYLTAARRRITFPGDLVEFVHGDALEVDLDGPPFDLVHAALLIEHVDPVRLLRRMAGWLADTGTCSVVSQNPAPGVAAVSRTGCDRLLLLDGHMSLLTPEEVAAHAVQAALIPASCWEVRTGEGRCLAVSTFRKAARAERESNRSHARPPRARASR